MHEEVIGMLDINVAQFYTVAMPQCFLCVGDMNIGQLQVTHFAEHLGSLNNGVGHNETVRVPQGGTRSRSEDTTIDLEAVDVPQRIFTLEAATVDLNITATLERRFSGMDGHTLEPQIVRSK